MHTCAALCHSRQLEGAFALFEHIDRTFFLGDQCRSGNRGPGPTDTTPQVVATEMAPLVPLRRVIRAVSAYQRCGRITRVLR